MYKKADPERKDSALLASSIKLETKPPIYNGDHFHLNPRYEGFRIGLSATAYIYILFRSHPGRTAALCFHLDCRYFGLFAA